MNSCCETDTALQLEEMKKQLAYYKRLSREAGDRRLRETEQLSRLILELKKAEADVEERNEKLGEANRALAMEVQERRDVQLALQKSREIYKRIISESAVGIAAYDADGQCTAANDALAGLLGMEKAMILQENYHDMAFWKASGLIESVKVVLEEKRTLRCEVEDETNGKGRLYLDCHLTPFLSEGILLIVNDVSEKKRFAEKLFQTQKMDAIATLAGGIAHDFNNELFTITAYLDLLKTELSFQESFGKHLNPMLASAKRMALLTSQLLAYAHGGKYQPQAISMSHFVKKTLPIIRPMIHPDIGLEPDLPEGVPEVLADVTQIQMVLSAVISNASEAIDGEGRIRIVVRDEQIEAASAGMREDLQPGHYVSVTVADTGSGMDEETRKKIFEPFFSTKFQGRGLGMAAVHGIVRNHDGFVFVDSEIGKGTVVKMYFPVL